MASNETQELLDLIDQRIAQQVPTQIPKWFSATVISFGLGTAIVHLPTDPVGTNITVQNPRELPLEIGDEVYIVAVDGKLTNAFVDVRKNITLDEIYVDWDTGVDDYKHGTESAPFKTLQYAVNRLPKNLNGRFVNIYFNSLTSENLIIDNFYGGGTLKIYPVSGAPDGLINSLVIDSCIGSYIQIGHLGCVGYNVAWGNANIYIRRVQACEIHGAVLDTYGTYGIFITSGSTVYIDICTISNHYYAIYASSSNVFSENNGGTNNVFGLYAQRTTTIGKDGVQPGGTTAEYHDSSSEIR
jgi:hypothetical protein